MKRMNLAELKAVLNTVKDDELLSRFAIATDLSTDDPSGKFGLIYRMEEDKIDSKCLSFYNTKVGKKLVAEIIKPLNRDVKWLELSKEDMVEDAITPDW